MMTEIICDRQTQSFRASDGKKTKKRCNPIDRKRVSTFGHLFSWIGWPYVLSTYIDDHHLDREKNKSTLDEGQCCKSLGGGKFQKIKTDNFA